MSEKAAWWTFAIPAAVIVVAASVLPPGKPLATTFFSSLRLAKPQPVTANPLASGQPTSVNRPLQDAIGGMISRRVTVVVDEPARDAKSVEDAAAIAGFPVHVPSLRTDPPTASVIGAHDVDMLVDRSELKTILMESGQRGDDLPAAVDGKHVVLRTPRAVRVQYGNCPAPANTIQAQIQGTPPPSTENGNCVVLFQSPRASADVPAGLQMDALTEIALELGGMSPNQAHAFQSIVDWRSTVVMSLPRGMRAYDRVSVAGKPAMLINTGGRRGPTWALVWANGDTAYELTGYGSSADALPLAESIR